MTISDQLPSSTTTEAKPRRPSQEGPTKTVGKHEFKKQNTIEDVLGEGEKRRSVSELVGDEFRQPFTLGSEGANDESSTPAAPTPADVAHSVRPQIERERRSTEENAAKGFLHASPTGVSATNADLAKYAEASTVGAGGHSTPKLPASGNKVEKAANVQGGAARRVRSASMEAAEIAKNMEAEQLREAQKNYALHAEIEAAKR